MPISNDVKYQPIYRMNSIYFVVYRKNAERGRDKIERKEDEADGWCLSKS